MAYILLARHGEVERKAYVADKEQGLSTKGTKEVEEVAQALVEHLQLLPEDRAIHIGNIRYSGYRHAVETAGTYCTIFQKAGKVIKEQPCKELEPSSFWLNRGAK